MYEHRRMNLIIGWSMGGLALLVYLMTTAPVVAFWDNGEFIAVGYTLGVGHPPGSPIYTLICRLFALLPFPNVARAVNFESVLAGALAIAFLYFAIAKMAKRWEGRIQSFSDGLPTYVAGVTACLFAAFSFSFWENALEAEVYATNILMMTATLWMVLKWSEISEVPRARRYLYLIIYLLGVGVGVHMGCLLWMPAFLLFVIFFERNFIGVILLGLPLILGFVLLSKGIMRGAIGHWLFWLVVTLFYAVPALWPRAVGPKKGAKRKGPMPHPATLPSWLTVSLGVLELVLLFATISLYGGRGGGWFLGTMALSALCVFFFVRLLQRGVIDRPEIPARVVLSAVVLGTLALSVHAYLLIRARLNPAINESDPRTWGLVLDVMRRKQYEPMRFFPRRTPFSNQFHILWGYYKPQFTVWPLFLAAWGAIAHARKDKRTFWMMATAAFLASIGLLFYMNISDHEVRTREYFWVPSYVGLALWMGIGSGAIVEWGKKLGASYRNVLVGALLVFALLPFVVHFHQQDRSDNYVAYYYGWNMINFLEKDALLITNGDNDTFPLWYLQQVEGIRPDVEIVNLSLLQINWYIKQLKDRGVPMSFTYEQIEQMTPYWTRDPETQELQLIGLRDITLHDIIRETNWTRPIYFAVTVDDFMGYYDYLELEGMVFKLIQTNGRHQVNVEKTRENVFENYRYDSLVDVDDDWRVMDEIYKPPTTTRLVTNYAAGFSRLAFREMQKTDANTDEAIRFYELARRFAPDYGPALNGLIAIYAARLYQPEKALPLAELLLASQPELTEAWVRYAGVNLMIAERFERNEKSEEAMPHYDKAMRAYEVALTREPDRAELYAPLATIYRRLGEEQKYRELLDLLGRNAPDNIKSQIDSLRQTPGSPPRQ
jgi:tetratricopeptide (TPR) repeat protein